MIISRTSITLRPTTFSFMLDVILFAIMFLVLSMITSEYWPVFFLALPIFVGSLFAFYFVGFKFFLWNLDYGSKSIQRFVNEHNKFIVGKVLSYIVLILVSVISKSDSIILGKFSWTQNALAALAIASMISIFLHIIVLGLVNNFRHEGKGIDEVIAELERRIDDKEN